MTFGKLCVASLVGGLLAGLGLFLIVYLFRDAFEASAEMGGAPKRFWAVVTLPAGVLGWGLPKLAERFADRAGAVLFIPLGLFVAAAMGTAFTVERHYFGTLTRPVVAPTIAAGVFLTLVASVTGWIAS